MLNKLKEKLKSMSNREPFDPAQFGDPLAEQVDWSPAKGGGTNIRTHSLKEIDTSRVEFRATAGAKFFYLIFLVVGLGVMIGVPVSQVVSDKLVVNKDLILPVVVGGIFACVGGALLYFGTAPIVFDKTSAFYWKGRKAPTDVYNADELKNVVQLHRIHALQLIREYCRGDKSSYYSYELNLVLEDGKRMNVVDHGNVEKLREDAATLSTFLGKPVWDGTIR